MFFDKNNVHVFVFAAPTPSKHIREYELKSNSSKDGLSKSMGGMRQKRVWGLSPGPHSRWDGASW